MRELALRVTEREARSVGEGRWFRASWRSWLPLMTVCFVATFVVMAVIPDDTANWIEALAVLPFAVGFLLSYCYFFRALYRAGKDFVRRVRSGQ